MKMEGIDTDLIVDTGATVNCITKHTIDKAGISNRIKPTTVQLFSASGARIKVLGEVKVVLERKGLRIPATLIVSDEIKENIIGAPILDQCNIDMPTRKITYKKNTNTIPIQVRKQAKAAVNTVRVEETIRPQCETTIRMVAKGWREGDQVLIEPLPNSVPSNVSVARAIALVSGGSVPVRILNYGHQPIKISGPIATLQHDFTILGSYDSPVYTQQDNPNADRSEQINGVEATIVEEKIEEERTETISDKERKLQAIVEELVVKS